MHGPNNQIANVCKEEEVIIHYNRVRCIVGDIDLNQRCNTPSDWILTKWCNLGIFWWDVWTRYI